MLSYDPSRLTIRKCFDFNRDNFILYGWLLMFFSYITYCCFYKVNSNINYCDGVIDNNNCELFFLFSIEVHFSYCDYFIINGEFIICFYTLLPGDELLLFIIVVCILLVGDEFITFPNDCLDILPELRFSLLFRILSIMFLLIDSISIFFTFLLFLI